MDKLISENVLLVSIKSIGETVKILDPDRDNKNKNETENYL